MSIVKLPRITETYSIRSYVNRKAFLIGWGQTGNPLFNFKKLTLLVINVGDQNIFSETLQYIEQRVEDSSLCEVAYNEIVDSKLCVSIPDGRTPSGGDSGGPLVTGFGSVNGRLQIGILSSGHTDGDKKGQPVLYTRVSSYLQWIKDKSGIAYY